jgi:hypothetical protein
MNTSHFKLVFLFFSVSAFQHCEYKYEQQTIGYIEKNLDTIYFVSFALNCEPLLNATQFVEFILNRPSILNDHSLSLEKIFVKEQIPLIEEITFVNLKGIDMRLKRPLIEKNIMLEFVYSSFEFYLNETELYQDKCEDTSMYSSVEILFEEISGLTFRKVNFPKLICPLIFANSQIQLMIFDDITNSYLTRNRLRFSPVNSTFNLNTIYLRVAKFCVYYDKVNSKMVNMQLFEHVVEMHFTHVVEDIEVDVFKSLKKLKYLHFKLDNFRNFFHQVNGTIWMKNLNEAKKSIMLLRFQHSINYTSFNKIYTYPNEDLCLFKDFPHLNLVYPIIESGKKLECTCTLLWLQIYAHHYSKKIKLSYDYSYNYLDDSFLLMNKHETFIYCNKTSTSINSTTCDFDRRFNNCNLSKIISNTFNLFNNDVNVFYFIKWLQFILLIILQPILALFGILTNSLSILCIRNKSKKTNFKDPMYKHIVLNSIFNISFCFITLFKLVNSCLFYNGHSPFCSSLYMTLTAQYFKIIVTFYMSDVIKICSNLTYISFTLLRFIRISNLIKNVSFIKSFVHIRIRLYFVLLILFSCLCNLFVLFQFTPNIYWNANVDFPYEKRNEIFCSDPINKYQCDLFNGFKISIKFLNDVIFVLIVIVIDLFLLHYFNKQMETKRHHTTDEAKLSEIKKLKKNLNKMILTNGFIFALAHLPEFVITILLVSYRKYLTNFCTEKLSCDLINEEAQFFCLISISFQFFIFLKFNKSFRESYRDLF